MLDLVNGLPEVLLSQETFFDDTSSPHTFSADCFDVGEVGSVLLVIRVFGYVGCRLIVLDVGLVFLHPRATISCCFADVDKIAVFAQDSIDDVLVFFSIRRFPFEEAGTSV